MTLREQRLVQAQYLSDWTLVRVADGRVGVFTKRLTLHRVTFPGQTGIEVQPEEELEVMKHPAELAMEALAKYHDTLS